MKIFVSYTLRDKELSEDFLNDVLDYYKVFGSVFLDFLTNDSINKQERVLNELDKSDKLILIETSRVYESEWVNLELDRAQKNKQHIEKITHEELKLKIKKKKAAANKA